MDTTDKVFVRFMKRVANSAEFKDLVNTALFGLSLSDSAIVLSRIGRSYGYSFEPRDVPNMFLEDIIVAGQLTDQQLNKFAGTLQIYAA